jgi:hypothetical protein
MDTFKVLGAKWSFQEVPWGTFGIYRMSGGLQCKKTWVYIEFG